MYRIFPDSKTEVDGISKPVSSSEYLGRHDDLPCIKGDYIALPGDGFITVVNWVKGQSVEIDLVSAINNFRIHPVDILTLNVSPNCTA